MLLSVFPIFFLLISFFVFIIFDQFCVMIYISENTAAENSRTNMQIHYIEEGVRVSYALSNKLAFGILKPSDSFLEPAAFVP